MSTSTSNNNKEEHQQHKQQKVHDQQNNFIKYLLGHGEFSTDVVDQLTEMVSLNQMSSVVSTCQELNNADLTLYVPPNNWNDGVDVRRMFTIMTATPTTKWIGRIDTSKVTEMKLGEKWITDANPTVVTDVWLRFVANGNFPSLTSLDLMNCNNITAIGITELVRGYPSSISIDMVDVFRRPEDTLEYALQAKELGAKHLWLQLGVVNHETRQVAEEHGLNVIMDRCPKIEFARLFGELGWLGFDTQVISSKKKSRPTINMTKNEPTQGNGMQPTFRGFDTKCIHAGASPCPTTGARVTPIYQNTAMVILVQM